MFLIMQRNLNKTMYGGKKVYSPSYFVTHEVNRNLKALFLTENGNNRDEIFCNATLNNNCFGIPIYMASSYKGV